MKRFYYIITVLFCSQFFLNSVNLAQEWRRYKVYRPQTERYFVCDVNTSKYQYNHDSSIAWFVDRWFCVWNANTYIEEGREGQVNVASTSFDGKTWTEPVPVFSDPDHSVLPVPHQQSSQWQPNLIVVDNELWAIWSQVGGDAAGCYFSKLSHPTGKWVNKRVEFDGKIFPIIEGEEWRVFPTQNPCQLKSGRVLAPVTINGPPAADSPPGMNAGQKRNTVIYTDDGGETWHISPGTFQPTKTWAQWEPTVWEPEPGHVLMLARNNDWRHIDEGGPPPTKMLVWSESFDKGETWTPHKYVPVETILSRMHVLPAGGDRFIMTHADAMYIGQHPLNSRENLALWFTRGDGVDFIAGPAYTADENATAYPQMWIHDGKMLACYSKGIRPRSIKVAHISPVPDPDTYYILPRDNRGLVESIKIDGRNALQFYDNYNSAGLDLDENDRMNNKVTVEFQFKIEKGNENALCTVGDAHHPAQVVVEDDQIYLQDSDEKITCGQAKGWTKVTVETFKKTTRVKVGDGKFKSVTHDPMATWFYFGQGYYRGRTVIWKNRFVIDVDSVQSRVTKLQ